MSEINNSPKNQKEDLQDLVPPQIVEELDRYIIGQKEAKRAVAIALRNRWRRLKVQGEMREEITPKNIIMIGPTGVGKTEIARRLAKLANAPFYKVEASKFTEVGYVGKDVESMVRDLVEISVNMVREQERERVKTKARENAEERLLDLLLPKKENPKTPAPKNSAQTVNPAHSENPENTKIGFDMFDMSEKNLEQEPVTTASAEEENKTREKLREMLRQGKLDNRKVDVDISSSRPSPFMGGGTPMVEIISAGGSLDDIGNNLRDMIGNFMPHGQKQKRVTVPEALEVLVSEEAAKLIDMETVTKKAVDLVENNGIIFIDEIDKIASARGEGGRSGGPDVSREGVQRDILPIVEGCTVSTKYGFIKTNHILFIASGAFHVSKPSDLIPELQGRFPIRVELHALKKEEFLRILTEPKNSLIKQYQALMATENIEMVIKQDALEEIAALAEFANDQMENIGARRLYTIMEKVMDEVSFASADYKDKKFFVDGSYVQKCLNTVIRNQDLSQYIL